MTIRTAMVAAGSSTHSIDVIEHEGELWLVPMWIENKPRGLMKPLVALNLSRLPHQDTPGAVWDFVVTGPLPESFLEGDLSELPAPIFVTLDRPSIVVAIPTAPH